MTSPIFIWLATGTGGVTPAKWSDDTTDGVRDGKVVVASHALTEGEATLPIDKLAAIYPAPKVEAEAS